MVDVHNVNTRTIKGAQAATRSVRILKLFLLAERGLTLAQIIERTGLNRTTTFRLLRALESEGMLERDDARNEYQLGPVMRELAQRAAGQPRKLSAVAKKTLDALATETKETISLETLDGHDAVVVAEAQGARILAAESYVGERWPAHATATGKVLLAALTETDRSRHLAARLPSLTEHTIVNKRELAAELRRVANKGHALNLEEIELGFAAIAVPVEDAHGATMAALSIGGPKTRLTQRQLKQWLPRLREAARELSDRWTIDVE